MGQKKEVYHVQPLTEGKKNIIAALMDEYDIQNTDDIQEALKDLLGGNHQIHDGIRNDRASWI